MVGLLYLKGMVGEAQEKGYPKGMPNYIKHTGGIPFAQVKQLMPLCSLGTPTQ